MSIASSAAGVSDHAIVLELPREQWPDLTKPRYDQGTYWGRAMHFFTVTNPWNLFSKPSLLAESKRVVEDYLDHDKVPPKMTVDQLWKMKHTFDSAHHPETHEKLFLLGRMSAQVPCNMVLTGCMMTFYKSTPAVIFWQWLNQSFNAVVNYSNRSGDSLDLNKLGTSYVAATSAALVTSLGMNSLTKHMPSLVGRFVPFMAVAAANAVNIPLVRRFEIQNGIAVNDEEGNKVGMSSTAAKWGISMVLMSRIGMAVPGMMIPPVIMNWLDRQAFYKPYRVLTAPLQVTFCGVCLLFMTPMMCALFPQQSSIAVSSLEANVAKQIQAEHPGLKTVYYNKGL